MATRWGICGAGRICQDFMEALKTLPSSEHQVVAAVTAHNLIQARQFAEEHDIPRAYGSYEELARDSDVDVVYVGTAHSDHLRTGKLFMKAGKNVLIEKPLAMHTEEVVELISTARKNGVFMMEAMWTRFFPESVQIQRRVAEGEVGEVQMVRADLGIPLTNIPHLVDRQLDEGAILDLGVYCLQFVLMVFSGEQPVTVHSVGNEVCPGLDKTMVIVLKFSGNRMAVCTCSTSVMLPNDAVIVGSKGTIKVPDHMWCPTTVEVNGEVSTHPLPEASRPLHFIHSTGLRYEAQEVRQCLLQGLKESPVMRWSDSSLLAALMDRVRQGLN